MSRVLFVPDGLDGQRVDAAAARMLGLSRSQVTQLIAEGRIQVDGRVAGKSMRVNGGSTLDVDLPDVLPGVVQMRPAMVEGIQIVHEDSDLIVIDKPAGVAAHPSLGWDGPSVTEHLAAAGFAISTSGAPERQGIVQRLDVGTSGLMVIAKSERAYSLLKQAFRNREVDKTYHALVQGHPDPFDGTIEAPIGRHPGAEWKMAIVAGGRHSVTHYTTVEAFVACTLLEIDLETGRTHQIRVHFGALHHPCVGDPLYGADPVLAQRLGLDRQWLHAVRLGFEHPGSGERVEFSSDYRPDLAQALAIIAAE